MHTKYLALVLADYDLAFLNTGESFLRGLALTGATAASWSAPRCSRLRHPSAPANPSHPANPSPTPVANYELQ